MSLRHQNTQKAQKSRLLTRSLGTYTQKSRTFLCGMPAPQVGLEPTTLRLTALPCAALKSSFFLLYVMQDLRPFCAGFCAALLHKKLKMTDFILHDSPVVTAFSSIFPYPKALHKTLRQPSVFEQDFHRFSQITRQFCPRY